MDKRLPLALFLSFLILIGWRLMFAPPPGPASPAGTSAPVAEQPVEAPPAVDVVEASEAWSEWLQLGRPGEPGCYWARFDNRGALLRELYIDGFWKDRPAASEASGQRESLVQLLDDLDTGAGSTGSLLWRTRASSAALAPRPLEDVLWEHEILRVPDETVIGVSFRHEPGTGVRFRKTIQIRPGTYDLVVDLGIENLSSSESGAKQFSFTPAACVPGSAEDNYYPEPRAVAVWRSDSDDAPRIKEQARIHGSGPLEEPLARGEISFLGVHGKYFAVLMRPAEPGDRSILEAGWRRVRDAEWLRNHPGEPEEAWRSIVADADLELRVPQAGAPESVTSYLVFAGPKSREILVAEHPDHAKLVEHDLGFFATIARFLLLILGAFHWLTGNWGWAIILLTLTVRLVLFPLNRRSQTTMAIHGKNMERIKPKLDEIKERYKNDRRALQQAQAKLMQEEGAFPPLGGCLPIFLQIPVFFGLFAALRSNFDLRQAPFLLWIRDLSQPDQLFRIDVTLPLIGKIEYLNVLPPLMVGLWIVQQRLMPKPSDPQQARMHRMMMWMPIMMGFFLYNYAAGLSLYMITQSLLGIFEIAVIKKYWPIDTTKKPKKKAPGFLARLAELQKRQIEEMQRSRGKRPPARDGLVKTGKKRR